MNGRTDALGQREGETRWFQPLTPNLPFARMMIHYFPRESAPPQQSPPQQAEPPGRCHSDAPLFVALVEERALSPRHDAFAFTVHTLKKKHSQRRKANYASHEESSRCSRNKLRLGTSQKYAVEFTAPLQVAGGRSSRSSSVGCAASTRGFGVITLTDLG